MRGGSSIQLTKVFGIRIGATPSWFFVLFLLIYILTGRFSEVLPGSDRQAFLTAVGAAILFEVSLVLHELGHALVARRYDIGITGIDLWFFGGLAKLDREPDTPGREFNVAAAGPLVTALIVGACLLGALAASKASVVIDVATFAQTSATPVTALLGFVAGINVLLLVFNLIPAYPLDGGRIARAAAWRITGDQHRGTRFAGRLGLGFAYLLIAAGAFLALRGDTLNGVWFIFLGFFMSQSAKAAVVSSKVRERLEGVTASDLMAADPLTMPPTVAAQDAQEQWFAPHDTPFFAVVSEDGRYCGLLRADRVADAVDAGRPILPVGELLDSPDGHDDARVAPDAALEQLLQTAAMQTVGAVMVVDAADRLQGVVTADQVRRALAAVASGR